MYTHERFRDQKIFTHFLCNFGLVLLIHLIILVLLIIISVISYCFVKRKKKNTLETERDIRHRIITSIFRKIRKVISVKVIFTMFLAFIVEIVIFALYNFTHADLNHGILIFSFYLAFAYFVVTIFFLLRITCLPQR